MKNASHLILLTMIAVVLSGCTNTGELQLPGLEPLGGGSFGLGRGSINGIFTGKGIGKDSNFFVTYVGKAVAIPVLINPGGNPEVEGQNKQLVFSESDGLAKDTPDRSGKVKLATVLLNEEDIGELDPPEPPNPNWESGYILSTEGFCVTGTAYKSGDLFALDYMEVTKDAGELYLFDQEIGQYREGEILGNGALEFTYVDQDTCTSLNQGDSQ